MRGWGDEEQDLRRRKKIHLDVIPAKAGIQENTGFRVKPGMTT
jgi:hypothetical protein